jgi:hypothetical protein
MDGLIVIEKLNDSSGLVYEITVVPPAEVKLLAEGASTCEGMVGLGARLCNFWAPLYCPR